MNETLQQIKQPIKPISFTGGSLPQPGTEAYKQAQQGVAPQGFTNITADSLANTTSPYTIPQFNPANSSDNIIQSGLSSTRQITKEEALRQKRLQDTQTQQTEVKTGLASVMQKLGLRGQETVRAREQAGLPELQKQADEIDSQIEAEDLALRRQVESIERQSGMTAGQKDTQIANLKREAARKIADLSIIQNARNRRLATAESLVNQKIALETEDLKNQRDFLKFLYDENKDFLDKEDERQVAKATKEADRKYQEAYDKSKSLESSRFEVYKNLALNNAPPSVYDAVSRATNERELIQAAGKNGSDIEKVLKIQRAKLDVQEAINKISSDGKLTGSDKFKAEVDLSKIYRSATGDYQKASTQIGNIRASYTKALQDAASGKSINAASQGVLVAFQKLLDPTSVVRESEYARSAEGLGLLSRIDGLYSRIKQGGAGVTAEDLKEFAETAETFLRGYEDYAITEAQLVIDQASSVGLNIDKIIPRNVLNLMEERFKQSVTQTPIGGTFSIGGKNYKKLGEDNYQEI